VFGVFTTAVLALLFVFSSELVCDFVFGFSLLGLTTSTIEKLPFL